MWSRQSRRRDELPKDWKKIREAVIRRDAGCCTFCGAPGNHVDHIDPQGPHELWNLRLLCQLHHMQRTAGQAPAELTGGQSSADSTGHPVNTRVYYEKSFQ